MPALSEVSCYPVYVKISLLKTIKRKASYFVYILECGDGTLYTGYTNDLKKRVEKHNKGIASKYTRSRLPVKVVWKKEYCYFRRAFLMEMRIKRLTRPQKERLVSGTRLGNVLADAKKAGGISF